MTTTGAERRRPSLASSAAMTFGTNVATALLSFGNVLLTARALGASGRGEVAFLTSIGFFSSWLFVFGVDQSNANLTASRPTMTPSVATNSVVLAVVFGTSAAGLVAGFIALVPAAAGGSSSGLRWLVLASLPVLILQIFLRQIVAAHYRFVMVNLNWLLPAAINVTVNAGLLAAGVLTPGTAIVTWVSGQALATVLLAAYLQRRLGGFGRPDPLLARQALRFGLKAHLSHAMNVANYRLDQLLLGGLAGSRELGLYSVAVSWAEGLFLLPSAIVTVQRPDLVRAGGQDASRQTATIFRATALVTLLLTAGLIALAPVLCVTVFGKEFAGSVADLRLLALGGVGVVAIRQLGNGLIARGRPLLESGAVAVSLISVVVLDFVLIPRYGGSGAALASALGYSAGGLAVAVIFSRSFSVPLSHLVPRLRDVPPAVRHLTAQAHRWRAVRTSDRQGEGA